MNLLYDENQAIDTLMDTMKKLDQSLDRKSNEYSMLLTRKVDLELEIETLKGRIAQCASAIGMIKEDA